MDGTISNLSQATPTSYPPAPKLTATNAPIHLQVGERRFTTTRSTLTEESDFFAALLSGRWDNALADGSYFIDADPALFEHILAYLRRGVFPLFYDASKGHDHHRYLSLLEEARYFRIPRLEAWLHEKRYLKAVQVSITAKEYDENNHGWMETTGSADMTLQYHPQWTVHKVHLCPKGFNSHRGNPDLCYRYSCRIIDDEEARFVEEPCMRMLVVRREVVFNQDVCVAREEEELGCTKEAFAAQDKPAYSNQSTPFALF
ncbi:BTB/POZ protein [Chaetomium tenue]|uniref:BTB/POZ protein n=1 Tax=Chaetomium tenue TaxID=1854479 RepID=A0ACB7P2G4_9PEZI|nr:BTB/POZ protein [Chaetomium globosum]